MRIIDVETMRRLEAETIAAGTSGYRLMRRAGEAATRWWSPHCWICR